MSFKFNPNAAEERKYITKPGTYEVIVKSFKTDYLPPRADFYVKFALENTDGETVYSEIFNKPDKSGDYTRLNEFIAATATEEEKQALLSRGEFEIDEDFIKAIAEHSVGRRLKVVVTERKYTKRDGSEGVAYSGSYFRRLPVGPF